MFTCSFRLGTPLRIIRVRSWQKETTKEHIVYFIDYRRSILLLGTIKIRGIK